MQTGSGAEQISPEKDKTLNQMEGGVRDHWISGCQHPENNRLSEDERVHGNRRNQRPVPQTAALVN